MSLMPPSGSQIILKENTMPPTLIVPTSQQGWVKYLPGIFLLLWLGGWTMGFISVSKEIMKEANWFHIFWLGGWTLGGLVVIAMIYRIFRPSVPETFVFHSDSLDYDSGIPDFDMKQLRYQKNLFEELFIKRQRIRFTYQDIKTLRLRDTEESNRLTMDHQSKRINLALGVSEVEREWLYHAMAEHYRRFMGS